MAETMQKINQKMNNLKKKNSNIMKKNFVETMHNFNIAFAFTLQKINKSKQTLNVKMTMMRINSDADKKNVCRKADTQFNELDRSQLSKYNEND